MGTTAPLGSVIRKRRLELGISQEQLAELVSADGEYVRQSEISRLECGRVGLPRRERLERIAAALGMSIGELLERSGWNAAAICFDRPAAHHAERGLPVDLPATNGVHHELAASQCAPASSSDAHLQVRRLDRTRHDQLHAAMEQMREETSRLIDNRRVSQRIEEYAHRVGHHARSCHSAGDAGDDIGDKVEATA